MTGSDLPIIRCPCGAGPCSDRVYMTERNPNRRFFTVPCGFFIWCDQVKALECRCGAGACSINMVTSGLDTGRWFFSCRVNQGHGACGFFQWVDPELNTKLNMARKSCNRQNWYTTMPSDCANYSSTINNDLNKCRPSSKQQQSEHIKYNEAVCIPEYRSVPLVVADLAMEDELPLVESQQCDTTAEVESSEHSEQKPVFHCENENPVSLCTRGDRVQPMPSENECSLSPSSKGEQVGLPVYCSMSDSNIHCDHLNAWRQISVCGVPLNCGIVYASGLPCTPVMSNENKVSLTLSSSGVFPSFNAIYVPKQATLLKLETTLPSVELDNATQSNIHATQLHHEPTYYKRSFDAVQEDISRGPVMEGFVNRLAVHLQTELVTLLKSIPLHDHGTMLQAANATSVALAGLSVDFDLFYKDVLEYIDCACNVTKIEASLQNGGNLQELIGQYITEKFKFDQISEINVEAVTALTAFDTKLQSFRDKVRQIKNLILQIETQLYYFEVKTLKLGEFVNEITRHEEEHIGKMQAALQELEEAFNVQQQKEREKHEANLALEKAGNKLITHM